MTALEAVRNLRAAGAIEPVEYFLYLASHASDLRLRDGQGLNDGTDFKAFLVELAEAVLPQPVTLSPVEVVQLTHLATCPRCGHIHQGQSECGEEMGAGRICRCELEVSA